MITRLLWQGLLLLGSGFLAAKCAPFSSPEETDGGENECNACHAPDQLHNFHLLPNPNVATPRTCSDCHDPVPEPDDVYTPTHPKDDTVNLRLQTWRSLTGNCEEWCHGGHLMYWDAKRYPERLGCTTDDCHRVTNPPHLIDDRTQCHHCHQTMDTNGEIIREKRAQHIDGTTDTEIGCNDNCHPYPSDLGAHETHLTTRWLPMPPEPERCILCHSHSSEKEILQQVWLHFAGAFFVFSGLATKGGRKPTMTNEKGVVTCFDTHCHVDGQPTWDEVWPTERAERCQKCHIELTGDQHDGEGLVCTECHEAELITGNHGDGDVETLTR